MYITPAEVLANIKSVPDTGEGQLTTELIQTFIDDGAAQINNRLDSTYIMPLPRPVEGQDDKYPLARASLKTLLQYYCAMRIELYMNIQAGMDEPMWQSVTNRVAYRKLYEEKLEAISTLKESLPDADMRTIVNASSPPQTYNDVGTYPNW